MSLPEQKPDWFRDHEREDDLRNGSVMRELGMLRNSLDTLNERLERPSTIVYPPSKPPKGPGQSLPPTAMLGVIVVLSNVVSTLVQHFIH